MTEAIETPFPATVTPMQKFILDNVETFVPANHVEKALIERIKSDLDRTKNQARTIIDHREKVRSLFEQINDHIKDEKLSKTDDISIKFLDEVLLDVFNSSLLFLRDYQVEMTHNIASIVTVTASNEDEARQLAEGIGVSSIEWDCDDNVVTPDSTWVIESTHIYQVKEA